LPRVLFISPSRDDAVRIGQMLRGSAILLHHVENLECARAKLVANRYAVVLTESALPDGGWLEVLELVRETAPVIVTCAAMDHRFWAEVLYRGGYDMLAQPFSEAEVRRVLSNVCTRISEPHANAA
jgi:DNA-binding NtrC family response regulator